MEAIERALADTDAFLVFVGSRGIEGWVGMELRVALDRAVRGALRIVPVLGPGAADPESLPAFLRVYQALDLRTPGASLQPLVEALGSEREAAPALTEGHPPYKGLDPFDGSDAHLFFGRDEEVQEVLARLQRQPVLAVVGDSGTGKSSLIRAGVIPALHAGRFGEQGRWIDAWRVGICRPGAQPVARLANALADALHPDLSPDRRTSVRAGFQSQLEEGPPGLEAVLGDPSPTQRHLIVVDQFEEVFTQGADRDVRTLFFDLLAHLPSTAVRVILTLRADFYDECWVHRGILELVSRHQYALPHMGPGQLMEIIEKPLVLAGLRMEEGLPARIVEDAGQGVGGLPVIQHALLELWRRRHPEGLLTHEAYDAMGGLEGTIAVHAEAVFSALDPDRQALAERVFLRLTDPRRRDVRRPTPTADLMALGPPVEMQEVLERLVRGRLVVARRQDEAEFWEVAHEALIENWPRYRDWLDAQKAFYAWLDRVVSQAEGWERMDRHASALLRGRPLAEAVRWERSHAAYLDERVRQFLRACIGGRRRRRAAWAAAGLVLLVAGATGWAEVLETRSESRATSVRDRARSLADRDPLVAALALAELPDRLAGSEGRQLLADVAAGELPRFRWQVHEGAVAHLRPAWEPDQLISTGTDGRIVLWRFGADVPESSELARHDGRVLTATAAPDGRLLTGGEDGVVLLHGPGGQAERRVASGGAVLDAFLLGSGRILTRSGDRLQVWPGPDDLDLGGLDESVGEAAVLPDGRVVVGTPSGLVRGRRAGDGAWQVLAEHRTGVGMIEVDPSSGAFLSTARDGGALLVLPSAIPPIDLPHTAEVTAASLKALASGLVVTGSADGVVRVWRVASPGSPPASTTEVVARAELGSGATARRVTSVDVSAEGDVVVAGSASGQLALLVRTEGGGMAHRELAGRGEPVTAVSILSQGRVVAGFGDGVMTAWERGRNPGATTRIVGAERVAETGTLFLAADSALLRLDPGESRPRVVWRHPQISSVAASADGGVVAVATGTAVHLIEGPSGAHRTSMEFGSAVTALDVSADGRRVAAGGGGAVRVWDETGAVVGRYEHPVSALAWRPDGTLLMTGDTAFWKWNGSDGSLTTLAALDGGGFIEGADLSEAGDRVALAAGATGALIGPPGGAWQTVRLPDPTNRNCGSGVRTAIFLRGDEEVLLGTRGGLWRWTYSGGDEGGEGEPGVRPVNLERNERDRCIGSLVRGSDSPRLASIPVNGRQVVVHEPGGARLELSFPGVIRGGAFRAGDRRLLAWTSTGELHERALTWDGIVSDLRAKIDACLTAEERRMLLEESPRQARSRADCGGTVRRVPAEEES